MQNSVWNYLITKGQLAEQRRWERIKPKPALASRECCAVLLFLYCQFGRNENKQTKKETKRKKHHRRGLLAYSESLDLSQNHLLQHKQHHSKVLLSSFHVKCYSSGFHPQTQSQNHLYNIKNGKEPQECTLWVFIGVVLLKHFIHIKTVYKSS